MNRAKGTMAAVTALSLTGTCPGQPVLNGHAARGVLASPARYPARGKARSRGTSTGVVNGDKL